MNAGSRERLERNVRLYPRYQILFNLYFWIPVFFLYFSEFLPLGQVLRLEAIYYTTVVVLEVPSGYFSDRFGRRRTLLVSSTALATSYTLFFFGSGFADFAAAQVCLAAGMAFNSGTDTALHFDSLAALGRGEEYARRGLDWEREVEQIGVEHEKLRELGVPVDDSESSQDEDEDDEEAGSQASFNGRLVSNGYHR